MQKYLFYCPTCEKFYSKNTDYPYEQINCQQCKTLLTNSGITKIEWDAKTQEDKDLLKKEFAEKHAAGLDSKESFDMEYEIKSMRKDIHTIASIVTFMFILGVVGVVVTFFGMLSRY